jgi:hypothetical protein
MLVDSGGGNFAGDGGPNIIWILYLVFGAVAAGLLGLVGSVICLFGCGATPIVLVLYPVAPDRQDTTAAGVPRSIRR